MASRQPITTNTFQVALEDGAGGLQFDYETLATPESRREYFQENGYVVHPGLLDPELCARAIRCFEREVKPYGGCMYRQASANPERHVFNATGSVMNSLLNPLSVDGRRFPGFRSISETILAGNELFQAVEELYSEPAVLVQSMYFEGNPGTWPHQDSYYLDADTPGMLTGAWIALEDIDAQAGRFYILPGSHRANVASNAGNLSIGVNHDRYKRIIHDLVESRRSDIAAPILRRGDVLLWSSRTVHGAAAPINAQITRNSYTAHFIPSSARFMRYECIPVAIDPSEVGGHRICRPKDQSRFINRTILALESRAPRIFPRLKKAVISREIRRRTAGSMP